MNIYLPVKPFEITDHALTLVEETLLSDHYFWSKDDFSGIAKCSTSIHLPIFSFRDHFWAKHPVMEYRGPPKCGLGVCFFHESLFRSRGCRVPFL